MSKNKTCIVCNAKYEYCGHCDTNLKNNRWKNNYCSENCRDIFKTVTDYIGKIITIEDAKQRLSKCNLNISATEQLNKYIVEILSYEEPKKESIKVIQTVTDEIGNDEKPVRRRRRRKTIVEE
jgi:hypothetical protein